MIKFWTDQDRFYTLVSMGYDTIFVREYFRMKRLGYSSILRDSTIPLDIRCIGFSDVRVNWKLLDIGFKI